VRGDNESTEKVCWENRLPRHDRSNNLVFSMANRNSRTHSVAVTDELPEVPLRDLTRANAEKASNPGDFGAITDAESGRAHDCDSGRSVDSADVYNTFLCPENFESTHWPFTSHWQTGN